MRIGFGAAVPVCLASLVFALLSAPSPASAQEIFHVTNSVGANVRQQPTSTAPIVTSLPKDTRIPFIERSGQWVKVEVIDRNGQKTTGYILGTLGLVELENPPTPASVVAPAAAAATPRPAPAAAPPAPVAAAPTPLPSPAPTPPAPQVASGQLTPEQIANETRSQWSDKRHDAEDKSAIIFWTGVSAAAAGVPALIAGVGQVGIPFALIGGGLIYWAVQLDHKAKSIPSVTVSYVPRRGAAFTVQHSW